MIFRTLAAKVRHAREALYILLAALALASLLTASIPSPALAQTDSTTVETLSLVPTFETISVYSNFSGDDNGDNEAVLEYRELGSTVWKPGISMTPDRREQLALCNYTTRETYYVDNPYKYQWRAVIFWLQPNTEYEVKVTYTDPDGVNGTNPVTATVRTLNDNPPSNGNTYYVATDGNDSGSGTLAEPFATIQHAADVAQPGDTVMIMPGVHTAHFDLLYTNNVYIDASRSGTADNWITYQSYDMNNKAEVRDDGGACNNFRLDHASYIRFRGLRLTGTTTGDFRNFTLDNSNNIIIEDNEMSFNGRTWASCGVLIRDKQGTGEPTYNVLIQQNDITGCGERTQTFGVYSQGYENYGIVIRDNTISDVGMKDGLSGHWHRDTFVHDNYWSGSWDDPMEFEGEDMNCAMWSNTLIANGVMCLGLSPVSVGPMYIFRNIFLDAGSTAIKMGGSSAGTCYFYHNTIYSPLGAHGLATYGTNAYIRNFIMRNNIVDVTNKVFYCGAMEAPWGDCDLDYDLLYTTATWEYLRWAGVNYDDLAQVRAALGYEIHGIQAPSLMVDPENGDLRLQEGSPCIDAGVILPGFNDENSPWPYQGYAPDMGVFELGSGGPIPTPTPTPSPTPSPTPTPSPSPTPSPTPTPTPTPSTTVWISPATQTVASGQFTVDVNVDPAVAIAGVQFDLSFDPSLITANSVTEGNLLSQSCSTFFQPGTIDNGAGTITGVAGAALGQGCSVSDPGTFATITFTPGEIEGTSDLSLSNVIVSDMDANPVSITVNNGSVLVSPQPWDVNGDGDVNVLDIVLVGQHWGQTGAEGWIPEDVNADGDINVLDIVLIGQHWGEVI